MSATAIPIAAAATLVAAAAVGGCAYAALWPRSQIFGKVLVAGDDPQQIALTYDDGPNPYATPQLLETLAQYNVRATFFLIGRYVRPCAELVREIQAAGHLIGNHSMTHPWLAWQSEARIRQELADCNAALEDVLGAPVRYFRPPHGARRPYVLRTARELGLIPVQWNVIVQDWKPVDAATILARTQRGIARNQGLRRSSNIVLHDGDGEGLGARRLPTVEATRQLLAIYQDFPKTFVTPDEWGGSS